MNKPDLGTVIGQSRERVKATKNVMSPLQWLIGIVTPASLLGLIFGPPDLQTLFAILFAGGPAFFVATYVYFGVREPDRLHTEEHREKMTQLSQDYQDSRGIVLDHTAPNVPPPKLPPQIGGA